MITKKKYAELQTKVALLCEQAGIVLNSAEKESIEVVDEGLGDPEQTGLQIVMYINTDRVCAKEIILLPHQTCPEHKHPSTAQHLGKEETFRCRWGRVYLYVPGPAAHKPIAVPPKGTERYYTVWQEIVLDPGDQYTIWPDTLHWFQAGPEGAIVSEFSTKSNDETDLFTNPYIERITVVQDSNDDDN